MEEKDGEGGRVVEKRGQGRPEGIGGSGWCKYGP